MKIWLFEAAVMLPYECTSWTPILVLLLHILLRIVAHIVWLPAYLVHSLPFDEAEIPSKRAVGCNCEIRSCSVFPEDSTSYTNPLFGQDWSSEAYCAEEMSLLAEMESLERDSQITEDAKGEEKQSVNRRQMKVLPVRAAAKKKPPPKPQRSWR